MIFGSNDVKDAETVEEIEAYGAKKQLQMKKNRIRKKEQNREVNKQ